MTSIILINNLGDWSDTKSRREFFDNFAKDKSFDPLVASNWYSWGYDDFMKYRVMLQLVFVLLILSSFLCREVVDFYHIMAFLMWKHLWVFILKLSLIDNASKVCIFNLLLLVVLMWNVTGASWKDEASRKDFFCKLLGSLHKLEPHHQSVKELIYKSLNRELVINNGGRGILEYPTIVHFSFAEVLSPHWKLLHGFSCASIDWALSRIWIGSGEVWWTEESAVNNYLRVHFTYCLLFTEVSEFIIHTSIIFFESI
jgi:hypothetical protein